MLKSTNNNKTLLEIEKKVSWLSNYIIHYANNIRVKKDDLKVGGHQSSSASVQYFFERKDRNNESTKEFIR